MIVWKKLCKELGRISNGYKDLTEGTNTVEFIKPEEIKNIPKEKILVMQESLPTTGNRKKIRTESESPSVAT